MTMKKILIISCILLLGLFAYQVFSFPLDNNADELEHNDNIVKSIDYELPKLTVLNGIENYSEIVQRPLFIKGRTPADNERTLNKVTSVSELSHLILVGTARSTEVQIGIIADTKAKQIERLKVGENYNNWKIAEISPEYVKFQNAEMEYKLFVTPIEGSTKAKQARLISQLNKSKINRAKSALRSYQTSADGDSDEITEKPKRNVAERSWGYNKKYNQKNENQQTAINNRSNTGREQVNRSPIKIPTEEEKDTAYYEGQEGDSEDFGLDDLELNAEDFYGDDDITEDELKALEALGSKIFID